ncbi:glycosyl hydrolase family 16 [Arthrobacter sp. SLBN-122]|nr:glycosyl hydrolase family 16 [Arthrobacter sp. SLBN-122]
MKTILRRAISALTLLVMLVSLAVVGSVANAVGALTFAPTADTYVQADRPTENFGTSVRWSTEGRTSIARNSLLRFNVQVPAGEHIVSAKLRAYSEAAATSTEFVDVYTTSGAWTETGVTWNNAPARGTWLGKTGGFSNGAWVEWDVTRGVTATGGEQNFRLESGVQKWLGFKSNQALDAALRPKLVITTEADVVVANPTPTPTPTPTPAPTDPSGAQAATTQNWGAPVAGDEFNYTGAPDATKWSVYNSAGHAGKGIRSPQQVKVDGSKMVMNGTPDGTTAGMSAKFARQKYGRWEVRAAGSGDNEYHMVSILWPDSGNWPCDGEVDYAETSGDWNVIKFFQHFSCSNSQTRASKTLDVSQFHNYAVDWSPAGMVGYVDGVKWFEDNDPTHQPPGSMHQTLQLDWFPDSTADGAGEMRVDWVRVYPAAGAAGLSPAPTPTPTSSPAPTSSPTPAPTTPPSGDSFEFAAVGDMNPAGNTSTSSASGKNAASIIGGLNDGSLDNFLAIGDFQYDKGTCSTLGAWNTLWGGLKAKTYWTTGPNHDLEPGVNDDVDRFMDGQCVSTTKSATSTTLGRFQDAMEWYSFDKGNWHILVAPTATWRYNASRAQAMTAEMDADLKAAKAAGKHLAAVYHDPYFTSNTSSHTRFTQAKPWIDMFWNNRVKVLLSGSQHNYERTCPVNNADQCVPDGMQQFQVSTGGIGLRSFTSDPAYIQRKFSDTWGHLRMSLKADGSYTWEFRPVQGGMQTDSGSRTP